MSTLLLLRKPAVVLKPECIGSPWRVCSDTDCWAPPPVSNLVGLEGGAPICISTSFQVMLRSPQAQGPHLLKLCPGLPRVCMDQVVPQHQAMAPPVRKAEREEHGPPWARRAAEAMSILRPLARFCHRAMSCCPRGWKMWSPAEAHEPCRDFITERRKREQAAGQSVVSAERPGGLHASSPSSSAAALQTCPAPRQHAPVSGHLRLLFPLLWKHLASFLRGGPRPPCPSGTQGRLLPLPPLITSSPLSCFSVHPTEKWVSFLLYLALSRGLGGQGYLQIDLR